MHHIHHGGRPGVAPAASELDLAAPVGYAVIVGTTRSPFHPHKIRGWLLIMHSSRQCRLCCFLLRAATTTTTTTTTTELLLIVLLLIGGSDGLQQQRDNALSVECIYPAEVVGTDVSLQSLDRVRGSTGGTVEAHRRSIDSLIEMYIR